MTDIEIPDLRAFLDAQIGGDIVSVDLSVNYVCPQCRDRET
jgi:hypothetical protein